MAIKDRKEREKLDKRKLIIESATRLFLEMGYEKTSIRTIADDIEYSPATIYLYFKEKDEIFFVLHEQGFDILNKEFATLGSIKDPFKRLAAMGKAYLDFAFKNPDYYDLMFIMRAPLTEIACHDKWEAGDAAISHLFKGVSECIDQKLIRDGDVFMISMTIWSYVHGVASLHIRERFKSVKESGDGEIQKMLKTSLDYFLAGLKV
ncbi:TetR/AcrR family transcriptional regulator [Pedobacter metabolipauper]|uniref:TetR family transcriptional regulator n=1 Tax=Pedobacter metabolipauper TaxID=425513 RepID=A0A4R6T0S1_9SPHI|nr:TetR/AcrR family transcriptional regulator [Pedobacter metabolipauper]TDQ10931.1 TetR family transcriptional regulator [Pedobacter metabolipauper]